MQWDLLSEVTASEVIAELKRSVDSSPGSDRLELQSLKACPPALLASMFNLWQVAEYLPPLYRQGHTVLIPKVQNPRPDQRRPITITCHLVRLLHRTLASRIGRVFSVLQRQKAFIAVDGCAENLAILGMLVHQAHSLKSDVCIALLDMAKAFDSVPWFNLDRCMRRVGIPPSLRRYILSSLEGSTTSLSTDGKACGEVKLLRGVEQGDPLSPLLFNLVIDELVAELEDSPCGVTVRGQRISCLAFADDLVLVATTTDGLQQLIRRKEETLKPGGLLMNPEKCRSMVLQVDRKAKEWYVNSEATFMVDGRWEDNATTSARRCGKISGGAGGGQPEERELWMPSGKRAERVEGGTTEATAAGVHLGSAPSSEPATQADLGQGL